MVPPLCQKTYYAGAQADASGSAGVSSSKITLLYYQQILFVKFDIGPAGES